MEPSHKRFGKGTTFSRAVPCQPVRGLQPLTDFDLADYKDEFTNKVRQLVEAKVKGAEIVAPPETEAQPAVVNLMDALKASLAKAQKAAKPATKPPRIPAPSVGAARQIRRRKTS